jgi:hypothetical protein
MHQITEVLRLMFQVVEQAPQHFPLGSPLWQARISGKRLSFQCAIFCSCCVGAQASFQPSDQHGSSRYCRHLHTSGSFLKSNIGRVKNVAFDDFPIDPPRFRIGCLGHSLTVWGNLRLPACASFSNASPRPWSRSLRLGKKRNHSKPAVPSFLEAHPPCREREKMGSPPHFA